MTAAEVTKRCGLAVEAKVGCEARRGAGTGADGGQKRNVADRRNSGQQSQGQRFREVKQVRNVVGAGTARGGALSDGCECGLRSADARRAGERPDAQRDARRNLNGLLQRGYLGWPQVLYANDEAGRASERGRAFCWGAGKTGEAGEVATTRCWEREQAGGRAQIARWRGSGARQSDAERSGRAWGRVRVRSWRGLRRVEAVIARSWW
jgi:hypothetical protein